MKHYTFKKAKKEIGKSIAWRDARKVSIKKWKEIEEYGKRFYFVNSGCGYCIVEDNRTIEGLHPSNESCGKHCPAILICRNIKNWLPETVLRKLKELKR